MKKILCSLIFAVLVLTLLSVSAFAVEVDTAEELAAAINAGGGTATFSGDTVTLTEFCTLAETITITGGDLTITSSGSYGSDTADNDSGAPAFIIDGGNLTLGGDVTILGDKNSPVGAGTIILESGSLTLDGHAAVHGGISGGSAVIVNGGTLNISENSGLSGRKALVVNGGVLNMTGGQINFDIFVSETGITANGGEINISGGGILGRTGIAINGGTVVMTGGAVNNDGSHNASGGIGILIDSGTLDVSGTAIINGGNGAPSSGSTDGKDGGTGIVINGGTATVTGVSVSGGKGGVGGRGTLDNGFGNSNATGKGGDGGNGIVINGGNLNISGASPIKGGKGGNAGTYEGVSYTSGNGGTGIVMNGGAVSLSSPAAVNGGNGGNAYNGTSGNGGDGIDFVGGMLTLDHNPSITPGNIGSGGNAGTAGEKLHLPASYLWRKGTEAQYSGDFAENSPGNSYSDNTDLFIQFLIYAIPQFSDVTPNIALAEGYEATSVKAFNLIGAPMPVVRVLGDAGNKVSWDSAAQRLKIAAGLEPGEYHLRLAA